MVLRAKTTAREIGLALLLCVGVSHAALALPSGGNVVRGQATISAPSGGAITITQSTNTAIIDWSKFSISANQSVTFDNGAGATLNRVTGADASLIDGALNATGSVYIVNPNGVIIGKSGVVNTGGSFVASTLDIPNSDFKIGSALTFSGASSAAVINLGYIGAAGRDVVLMAYKVQNAGTISAPNGDIGLLTGSTILLRDMETQNGMFAVELGGPGSVMNSGGLQAAMVELRANGGNVYALAGNTTGVINATGVSTHDGQVFLTAGQGYTDVQCEVTATQSDGAGGQVTTSGATVDIVGANIQAGNWTLEQDNFVLTPEIAAAISANLANTSIIITTVGTEGRPSSGNIFVAASLTWGSFTGLTQPNGTSLANSLTLSAHRDIDIASGQTIVNEDDFQSAADGPVTLAADNDGRGVGTVNLGAGSLISTEGAVSIFYNPPGIDHKSINGSSYTNPTNYSNNVTSGSGGFVGGGFMAYMYVDTIYDLQNIENNTNGAPLQLFSNSGGGNYVLGKNINAALTANWNDGAGFIPIGTFAGTLLGDGHSISNLTINSSAQDVGLFSVSTGTITGVDIKGGNITGANTGTGDAVGSLVGVQTSGTLSYDSDSATVSGANYSYVGGLVGLEEGSYKIATITNSSSSGSVSGGSNSSVGGLVGAVGYTFYPYPAFYFNTAVLNYSNSSANINGYASSAGGLVGSVLYFSALSNDSSIGVVDAIASSAGGLVGSNVLGTIEYSWSSSLISGPGQTGGSYGGFVGSNSGIISNSYSTGSVTGIVAAGTNVGGFVGSNDIIELPSHLGSFSESGSISNSYATGLVTGIAAGGSTVGGFAGSNSGTISNSYSTGSAAGVSDASDFVGGFAGNNIANATIEYVYSIGSSTGGGLVGQNSGQVGDAYWDIGASGNVIGVSSNTGKLESVRGLGGTTRFSPFSAASYVGFDFTNTWTIDQGVSWPTLR